MRPIPVIMNLIDQYLGQQEFVSIDAYENVLSEFRMMYSPEIMELLFQLSIS